MRVCCKMSLAKLKRTYLEYLCRLSVQPSHWIRTRVLWASCCWRPWPDRRSTLHPWAPHWSERAAMTSPRSAGVVPETTGSERPGPTGLGHWTQTTQNFLVQPCMRSAVAWQIRSAVYSRIAIQYLVVQLLLSLALLPLLVSFQCSRLLLTHPASSFLRHKSQRQLRTV